MTIKARFMNAKPRAELARTCGISAVYAHDIAHGILPIGSTKMFARIVSRLDLSPEEVVASLREMYPAEFDASAASHEAA